MRLTNSSLHMKTLTAEYRRLMLLHMFAVYILGLSEHPTENEADKRSASALRALTHTKGCSAAIKSPNAGDQSIRVQLGSDFALLLYGVHWRRWLSLE